jgi:Arc/MetJ family transcription regulator
VKKHPLTLFPAGELNPYLCDNIKKKFDIYALIVHINTYNIGVPKGYLMRTTLNIEDKLISKASKLTGIKEKTSLVKLGLEALIAKESAKRLAKLGGTEKDLKDIPRRRIEEK